MSRPTFIEELDNGDIIQYWNCPIKFIPNNILEFLKDYRYIKQFPSVPMPKRKDLSPRFEKAMYIYENELSNAMNEKRKHG